MKKIKITIFLLAVSITVWSQTNTFPPSGDVGIGTTNPDHDLQIHSSNLPTLAIGKLNANTNGKSILKFYAGNEAAKNGFTVAYNKTSTVDQLAFIDGGGREVIAIQNGGKVGIGTTDFTGNHMLRVEGSIGAREIKVEASGWSDFVFEKDYKLRTLEEVENYISENKHLPEIPSEEEVTENGINLGEMNAKLLQKVEELTLYLIEQNKENQEQRKLIEELQKEVSALKNE